MMRKCRITVLKTTFMDELVKDYGVDGFGPCTMHQPGQVFVTDFHKKPDGLCDEAWRAFHHYVFALAHGGAKERFFRDNWTRDPEVAICSCNDGLRPVIFKIEPVSGEAGE